MRHQPTTKALFIAFLTTAATSLLIYAHARAYLMPPEQLVGFMAANFSNFKTMLISQSTNTLNSQSKETEKVFEEKIWMKSPGFYRSDPVRQQPPDMNFRRILMANDRKALLSFLSEMGIDINTVSLTRFGGFIAYRIGKGEPESSILLIEKEKFLPLFLRYRIPVSSGERRVTVRFENYKKLEKGWFPYKIIYSAGNDMEEEYFVKDLEVNIPVESPLSKVPVRRTPPADDKLKRRDAAEERRLQEVIETIKKKYQ